MEHYIRLIHYEFDPEPSIILKSIQNIAGERQFTTWICYNDVKPFVVMFFNIRVSLIHCLVSFTSILAIGITSIQSWMTLLKLRDSDTTSDAIYFIDHILLLSLANQDKPKTLNKKRNKTRILWNSIYFPRRESNPGRLGESEVS